MEIIDIIKTDGQTQISIKGAVNEQGAENLKTCFDQLDLGSTKKVIIDCQQLEYIGSACIGKLLILYKRLTEVDGSLSVINLPDELYQLFIELKLDTLFTISAKTP